MSGTIGSAAEDPEAGRSAGPRHDFTGKVAIVTGAAQGIGEAYAHALGAAGAAVVVADIKSSEGETVAKDIRAGGGQAAFAHTDVADPDSAAAMADLAMREFGGIDFLVNNAGILADMKFDLLTKVDWAYYKHFMGVNMDGALACTRACYRHMARRGGGAIVNQSSSAAWMYASFYSLAKVGVNGLTQQLAHELGGRGIRVNAIAPGPIDTAATRAAAGSLATDIVRSLAIKRMGMPADLVGMCLFLLSDEASWISGQIFNVDGGQVFRA